MTQLREERRKGTEIPVVALEQFKDEMKDHVAVTIEKVVNGGIREIKKDVADIKVHLGKQDEDIKRLSDKVEPLDGARTWMGGLVRAILYLGAFSVAALGIFKFLQLLKVFPD